jgi:hypothetical protein
MWEYCDEKTGWTQGYRGSILPDTNSLHNSNLVATKGVFDSAQVGKLLFINIFRAITETLLFPGTRCPLLRTEPMVPVIDSAERC